MSKLLKIIDKYLGQRRYYLRMAFFCGGILSLIEGLTLPFALPDFQDLIGFRAVMVVLFFVAYLCTYRENWQKFNPLYLSIFFLAGLWINLIVIFNYLDVRHFLWITLCLFAWGYAIENQRRMNYLVLFYLIVSI